MERRLAAVLIADVVGYGRLTQIDEEGTRACFQADLSEVLVPKITEHHGRLVKTMGDGLLVEFHSVFDALRCAIEMQQSQSGRNSARAPHRKLEFRIGINLGDVIVEGDDIHGDGVIIAERLQALAQPGGVCVSGSVFDQVEGKSNFVFRDAGRQVVKNISNPIRIYRASLDEDPVPGRTTERRATRPDTMRLVIPAALVVGAAVTVAFIWQPWSHQSREAAIEYHLAGRHEDAVSTFRAAESLDLEARLYLVVSLVRSNQVASAQEEAEKIMRDYPRFSVAEYLEKPDFLEPLEETTRADFAKDLGAAGLPEYVEFDCLVRGDCK
jgi:class 3 adenylate cyclase